MTEIFKEIGNIVLYQPVLNLLVALYHLFGNNLGLAVIALAVIARIAMYPLTKSQTNMAKKLQSLQPKLKELQKKYANNQEALAKEQMKLYKESGYNPLGCIFSYIPFLIIIMIIFNVVKFITSGSTEGIYPFIQQWVAGTGDFVINTNFLGFDLASSFNSFIQSCDCVKGPEILKPVTSIILVPIFEIKSLPYVILAIFVGIAQYFSTFITQKFQGQLNPQKSKENEKKKSLEQLSPEEIQMKSMKYLNIGMSVMTIFIALGYSAVLSIYWIAQSFLLVSQYLFSNRKKLNEILNFNKINKNETGRSIKEGRGDSK